MQWTGPAGEGRWGLWEWHDGGIVVDLAKASVAARIRPAKEGGGMVIGSGGAIYTIDQMVGADGSRYGRLRILDAAGNVTAEHRLAATFLPELIELGWAERDRRIWYLGSDPAHGCHTNTACRAVTLTLPETKSAAPQETVRLLVGKGKARPLEDGILAMSLKGERGLRFFRSDSSTALTAGTVAGDPFAYAPDGRWACSGRGCEIFACVASGQALDPTAPACAGSRVAGFDLLAEVKTPPPASPAGK